MPRLAVILMSLSVLVGCDDPPRPSDSAQAQRDAADPQLLFWAALEGLCGQAFAGVVTQSVPPDESFDGVVPVAHVRDCDTGVIRIPFHVGEDRSRTWVVASTSVGLHLSHAHRHEDGTEDEVTGYGGDTRGRGEPTAQEFFADDYTVDLVPAAAGNVWTIEVGPGPRLVYALRREGSDRRFRVEFDLSRPVRSPPPPWGG